MLSSIIDFGYWVLPKPADMGLLLYNALDAGNDFGSSFDPQVLGAARILDVAVGAQLDGVRPGGAAGLGPHVPGGRLLSDS